MEERHNKVGLVSDNTVNDQKELGSQKDLQNIELLAHSIWGALGEEYEESVPHSNLGGGVQETRKKRPKVVSVFREPIYLFE